MLVARRVERDGNFYAGPFLPAKLARRTMALTHRLFGIRSCNEVITGKRGRPCLEYDIKRCIAPCVADDLLARSEYARRGRATRSCSSKAATTSWSTTLRGRMARGGRRASGSRRRRSCATRCARSRRCATASRRWRRAELGDRDVFGLKLGPGRRRRPGVPGARRPRRRARRARDRRRRGARRRRRRRARRRRSQQFYEDRRAAAGGPPAGRARRTREALEAWLSARAGRRVRHRRPAARRQARRWSISRRATPRSPIETRFNETRAAHYDALETLRGVLALPALPRRIECFDISTIQGSETVASMVVCEDGRMQKGEYRKFRIRDGPGRARSRGSTARHRRARPEPRAPSPDPGRLRRDAARSCGAAIASVLEDGGPFPGSDPDRRRQGPAVGRLRRRSRSSGSRTWSRSASPRRRSCCSRATATSRSRSPRDDPALLLLQRIRDEAHRFAVTFHRQSRARSAICARSSTTIAGHRAAPAQGAADAFGSLAGVRRATREELVPRRRRESRRRRARALRRRAP